MGCLKDFERQRKRLEIEPLSIRNRKVVGSNPTGGSIESSVKLKKREKADRRVTLKTTLGH